MDIMIIGAGIGGLTAAIALQRQGHRVRVCEVAPELKPVGAGLWVAPNCLDAFPQLSAALAAYEQRRIPKASSVVNTSWQINQMVNLRNPLARRARNFVIRHLSKQLSLKQFDKLYTLSV